MNSVNKVHEQAVETMDCSISAFLVLDVRSVIELCRCSLSIAYSDSRDRATRTQNIFTCIESEVLFDVRPDRSKWNSFGRECTSSRMLELGTSQVAAMRNAHDRRFERPSQKGVL